MHFSGELAAILTTLVWSIGIFPFTEASKRLGSNPLNHFRLVVAIILLWVLLAAYYGLGISDLFLQPDWKQWLWLGLSGIMGLTIGDYFAFRSMELLGARLSSAFSTLSPVAALLFGLLFLSEDINVWGILGLVVTVGGVLWLGLSKGGTAAGHLSAADVRLGIVAAVLSPVCQGIGLVFSKLAFDVEGAEALLPAHAAWMRMVCAGGSLYLFTVMRGSWRIIHAPLLENRDGGLIYGLAGAFFGPFLGMCLSMYTVSKLDASVAQTIFSLVPVFVTLGAMIFYRERVSLLAWMAMLISIAGVLVIVWRNEIGAWF